MKRFAYYILDETAEFATATGSSRDLADCWNDITRRRVRMEQIGESTISTVFLVIDHNWYDDGPPIMWETMVFGGPFDHYQDRCSGGREQAEAMHAEVREMVLAGMAAVA